MLYPLITASRKVFSLDGYWKFKLDNNVFNEKLATQPLREYQSMVVPSSFNDLDEGEDFRDYSGWMYYEREFTLPQDVLDNERIVVRLDAATHFAKVYVNGKFVVEHMGGFTPFCSEINKYLVSGTNRISVAIDNTIDESTLPTGDIRNIPIDSEGHTVRRNVPNCDFFNYSGLNRSVRIFTTPKNYIEDISLVSAINGSDATISYSVKTVGSGQVNLKFIDESGQVVAESSGTSGQVVIKNANLWWPLNAYLYSCQVSFAEDSYTEEFGIRTVEIKNRQFLINNKPFYFKGYGKHEDAHVNGRGLNPAYYLKDINLMKWMGANSFRTSHYPYSEEFLRLCDREGIVVIDECAAVGLFVLVANFGFYRPGENSWQVLKTADNHRRALEELVARDKNHACVVMWSVSNEAGDEEEGAYEYFKPLFDLVRTIDPQKRPVSNVLHCEALPDNCKTTSLSDVICLNRYNSWYSETSHLRWGVKVLHEDVQGWLAKYPDKPIMFTEYGVDTIAGFHDTSESLFTEENQVKFYKEYGKLFDSYDEIIGEQLWNFADFATVQGIWRVQGNKKGVFSRDRRPKMAASYLKERWTNIPDFNYKKTGK